MPFKQHYPQGMGLHPQIRTKPPFPGIARYLPAVSLYSHHYALDIFGRTSLKTKRPIIISAEIEIGSFLLNNTVQKVFGFIFKQYYSASLQIARSNSPQRHQITVIPQKGKHAVAADADNDRLPPVQAIFYRRKKPIIRNRPFRHLHIFLPE